MATDDRRTLGKMDPATLFTLEGSDKVRLNLPPVPLPGSQKKLALHFDFEVEMVAGIIARLQELQAKIKH